MTGRRLLAAAADLQRRADVVFVGFVFMTLLDLGLLVLFGIQHPSCKQRSPRVYISGVDQGAGQQGSGKEKGGGGDRISLQVCSYLSVHSTGGTYASDVAQTGSSQHAVSACQQHSVACERAYCQPRCPDWQVSAHSVSTRLHSVACERAAKVQSSTALHPEREDACMLTCLQRCLQVMAVPASRQGSGVSMHELRLPSSSSVTAHRWGRAPTCLLAHGLPCNLAPASVLPLLRGVRVECQVSGDKGQPCLAFSTALESPPLTLHLTGSAHSSATCAEPLQKQCAVKLPDLLTSAHVRCPPVISQQKFQAPCAGYHIGGSPSKTAAS